MFDSAANLSLQAWGSVESVRGVNIGVFDSTNSGIIANISTKNITVSRRDNGADKVAWSIDPK